MAPLQQVLAALKLQSPEALVVVRGIGISGQMHGVVLLDDQGRVLRDELRQRWGIAYPVVVAAGAADNAATAIGVGAVGGGRAWCRSATPAVSIRARR